MKITASLGIIALALVACSTEPGTSNPNTSTLAIAADGTAQVALTLDRVP
jgi:hypothetical protein